MIIAIRRLISQQEGNTALEFASIARVLFLLVFGIIEFSLIMFASSVLESATNISARLGRTGNEYTELANDYNQGGLSRDEFLRQEVRERTFGLLDPSQVVIESRIYANIEDVDASDPANPAAGFGGSSDVVLYKVRYDWPLLTPLLGSIIGNDAGKYELSSSVIVRNEAY